MQTEKFKPEYLVLLKKLRFAGIDMIYSPIFDDLSFEEQANALNYLACIEQQIAKLEMQLATYGTVE